MGNSTMDKIFYSVNKDEFEEYLRFYYVLYYRSLSLSSSELVYKVPDFYKFLRHVINHTAREIMVNGLTFTRLRDDQWIPTLYQMVDKAIEKSFRTCAKMRDVLSKNMSILSTPVAPPPPPPEHITTMPGPVLPELSQTKPLETLEAKMEDVPESENIEEVEAQEAKSDHDTETGDEGIEVDASDSDQNTAVDDDEENEVRRIDMDDVLAERVTTAEQTDIEEPEEKLADSATVEEHDEPPAQDVKRVTINDQPNTESDVNLSSENILPNP